MKQNRPKYSIDQCALYKCQSRKRLEALLTIETGDLRNIQSAIKYSSFQIEKKHSDEKRTITAPQKTLKAVQARILSLIERVDRPEWLISGEKGKCYIDNGKAHQHSNYMLAIDIRKFYDNCKRNGVYLFFKDKLKTSPDVAKVLTDIVTYNNGIPTGCPTSQLVAYYAYEDMFLQIQQCAAAYGCVFTLYVDDMTFSNTVPFQHEKLLREVDIILRRYGHRPKYKKVKYYAKDKPKPITGTIVTPEHTMDVPNQLQEKVYNNFQKVKTLTEHCDPMAIEKATQSLLGQIQAAQNLDYNRFPEIERLTKIIRSINRHDEPKSITPKKPTKRSKMHKIHIASDAKTKA